MKKSNLKKFAILFATGLSCAVGMLGIQKALIHFDIIKESFLSDSLIELIPIWLIVYISAIYFSPIKEGFTKHVWRKRIFFRSFGAIILLLSLKLLWHYNL